MGLSKTHQFTVEQNSLAEMAKALAHPARIAILQYLSTQKNCVCGSIVNEVGLAQATVSQHLKALKEAGFIDGTVEGASVCYCLNTEKLGDVRSRLSFLLDNCCTTSSCC
ncbi:MAG: metalloregulator ArsR/SmtB family transcription factor [Flavobacteriales bacterium]|nr:metalloregulator ArsR/SmtB family transcription factor [Flavobacteriales bacterium]